MFKALVSSLVIFWALTNFVHAAEVETNTKHNSCVDALASSYIDGEKLLGSELIRTGIGEMRVEYRICGISDKSFAGFGNEGRYVNAMVINPGGYPTNVAFLKKLVDKYSKRDTFVTHIVIDPIPDMTELK